MSRILNSDGWAHGLPCALLAALILAIALGGCAALRDIGGQDTRDWWQQKERWRGSD